jgi:hypothetical protein
MRLMKNIYWVCMEASGGRPAALGPVVELGCF